MQPPRRCPIAEFLFPPAGWASTALDCGTTAHYLIPTRLQICRSA